MIRLAEQEEFHSLLRTCEYTIASPSKNYHPQTDKLVATSKDKVKREVLNIEEDLHSQEFGDRKFDAVVCFDMLNSDFQPEMAMANVKQLLKPTGAACLVDATDQGKQSFAIDSVNSRYVQHILAQMDKAYKALGRSGELHQLLDRHGLMMNFQVSDFTKPEVQQLTLTIGTPDNTLEHIKDTEIVLITRPNASPASEEIVAQLAKLLKSQSYSITNFVWGSDLSVLTGKHCLALLELDHSMMYDLSERDFVTVRQLILEAKSTFWVVGHDEPSAAMITGLARVVRNEVPGIDFRTFLYDRHSQVSNWEVTVLVAKVLGSTSPENEFVVKSGVVNICRVDEDTALNSEIELLKPNSSKRTATTPLGQVKCPQKLCALTPGLIESLCFEADELALSELSTEMVEINVKATSLRQVDFDTLP
jgi:SAM-dependent methyltransferase